MKASEGKLGRVFLVRLDDGDDIRETLERFALDKNIQAAHVFMVADQALSGIIAPNAEGVPRLRMPVVDVGKSGWAEGEMVIQEVVGINFRRVLDPASGKETLARVSSTKTRVMEKPSPTPETTGPGTIPVYLFNADFN